MCYPVGIRYRCVNLKKCQISSEVSVSVLQHCGMPYHRPNAAHICRTACPQIHGLPFSSLAQSCSRASPYQLTLSKGDWTVYFEAGQNQEETRLFSPLFSAHAAFL